MTNDISYTGTLSSPHLPPKQLLAQFHEPESSSISNDTSFTTTWQVPKRAFCFLVESQLRTQICDKAETWPPNSLTPLPPLIQKYS